MAECEQGGENPHEVVPPLSIYESTQVRSVNLNELIRIHRSKQRYQIWDKFFNNSYICIDNKVHPVEIYYQNDRFKSYLEDLNMVYFKDIEFNQNVRLQYIIRRLNFTLNGQNYDFTQFLKEHSCYDQIRNIFTEDYLQELQILSNDKKVISLRNSLFLSYLLYELATYQFTHDQSSHIIKEISMLYSDLKTKISYESQVQQNSELLSANPFQCAVNSITNQSEKTPDRCDEELENESHLIEYLKSSIQNSKPLKNDEEISFEGINYFFDDLIYQEEISLKIIEIELENYYFSNQLNDPNNNEELKFKLKYLSEINKEYIGKLKELRELNSGNREILKKIQKNISIEFNTGRKCIVIDDSDDYVQCFGVPPRLQSKMQLCQSKYERVTDSQAILHIVLKSIKTLRLKQIADAIEKVYQIQRIQNNQSKHYGKLMFSVCFERGLGVKEANFCQKDFLMLNELRQESTLTSYLTPMKSYYSYISHNIFTFLNIYEKQFPYHKEINNNEEVLRRIKNKISRHRNLGKAEIKDLYYHNFKICHNCKILCQKSFLRQCKRRVKHQKFSEADDQDQPDDDSLYTERDAKNRKHSGLYIVECEKSYCIYCINNQFNGKLFNEKGWCPSCLDMCPCNTCLRAKMIKKLVELYVFTGGDVRNIKSEKQIIEGMRISRSHDKDYSDASDQDSFLMTQTDDKIYEDVIKREIMKGYSAEEVEMSLRQQEEIIGMIIDRETIKLQNQLVENAIFRNKVKMLYGTFDAIDQEIEQEKQLTQKQKQINLQRGKEEVKNRKRERRDTAKSSERRKCRKLIRDQEIYYEYFKLDVSDSSEEESSFHISKQRSKVQRKKCKEYKYEPEYTF